MTELASLVLAGAVAGGLYAILASGLVLTYQTSGVFNVGHGAIAFTSTPRLASSLASDFVRPNIPALLAE